MTEKELISKLQELRQIKPNQNWTFSLKSRILAQEPAYRQGISVNFFPFWRPAFATLVSIFVLVGLFGFSQNSLPGDLLYPVKKIVERGEALFVSEQEKPQASLELAGKRLEELAKIAQTNQARKLPQAITEFQASANQVAKNFSKTEKITANSEAIQRIVELGREKQVVEKTLATQIETEELDNTYKNLAEYFIEDLSTRTLTEGQAEILNQMKELVEQGKYSAALELYLINQ